MHLARVKKFRNFRIRTRFSLLKELLECLCPFVIGLLCFDLGGDVQSYVFLFQVLLQLFCRIFDILPIESQTLEIDINFTILLAFINGQKKCIDPIL